MLTRISNHETWQDALGEICAEMLKGNEHTVYVQDKYEDIRWEINSYHFPMHEDGNKWGINVFDQEDCGADGEDSLIINHERIIAPLEHGDFIFVKDFFVFISIRIRNLLQEREEAGEQQ